MHSNYTIYKNCSYYYFTYLIVQGYQLSKYIVTISREVVICQKVHGYNTMETKEEAPDVYSVVRILSICAGYLKPAITICESNTHGQCCILLVTSNF